MVGNFGCLGRAGYSAGSRLALENRLAGDTVGRDDFEEVGVVTEVQALTGAGGDPGVDLEWL